MYFRQKGVQPDAIGNMHLFDALLEIYHDLTADDPSARRDSGDDNRIVIEPKPGQSTRQAMREAGLL